MLTSYLGDSQSSWVLSDIRETMEGRCYLESHFWVVPRGASSVVLHMHSQIIIIVQCNLV